MRKLDAVSGCHHDRQRREDHQRRDAADRHRQTNQHGQAGRHEHGQDREEIDELAHERLDWLAHDHGRRLAFAPGPANHQRHQNSEAPMASEDEHPLLEQSAEIGDHGFRCAQATPDIEHTLARFREPQQMWKRDHHSDDPGEPGISRAKASARTPVHKREQRQQADQEQTRIGRQQQ